MWRWPFITSRTVPGRFAFASRKIACTSSLFSTLPPFGARSKLWWESTTHGFGEPTITERIHSSCSGGIQFTVAPFERRW